MACACLLDDEAKAQLRVSKAIEREMEQWKKDASKEFKLLLLGKRSSCVAISYLRCPFIKRVGCGSFFCLRYW